MSDHDIDIFHNKLIDFSKLIFNKKQTDLKQTKKYKINLLNIKQIDFVKKNN